MDALSRRCSGSSASCWLVLRVPVSTPPLDNKTKTGPQHDIPCAIKVGKTGWRGWQRIPSPRRVSLSPLSPRHRQLNICLLKSHFPPLHSKPPLSLYSRSMPQDGDQSARRFTGRPRCFTASLTAPPDPDSHQDISPAWLAGPAHPGAACPTGESANLLRHHEA